MSALIVSILPGAGRIKRLAAWTRGLMLHLAALHLMGTETVVLQGRVLPVCAVPLGVARNLVPAIVRCGKAFAAWDFNEALYDDLVKVLALGLRIPEKQVEALQVSLFSLAPVVDKIARVNGLLVLEAGSPDMGKLLAALTRIGTNSMPSSSAPPAGAGSTSTGG